MKVLEYKVKMDSLVDRELLHSFLTFFFEKPLSTSVKTSFSGKVIRLYTDKAIDTADFSFSTKRHGSVKAKVSLVGETNPNVKKGSRIAVSGVVAYSKTLTKPLKINGRKVNKICPVDARAKDNLADLENLTAFVNRNLGISFDPENIKVSPAEPEFIGDKKRVYDAFYLEVEGVVDNPQQTIALYTSSVGSSKSYGFGSMTVGCKE